MPARTGLPEGRAATRAICADIAGTAICGGDTDEPRNMRKRVGILRRHLPAGARRVLDGGCGRGGYVVALRQQPGLAAFGVEYQAEKVVESPLASASGVVIRGDLEQLGIRDSEFDAALLNEVLEHVPSDRRALEEIRRILRPGGKLVVMSPNRLYPFESHGVYLRRSGRRLPVYVPFLPYVPLRLGRLVLCYWARNYWPSELRHLVEEAGFHVVDTAFVWQTFEGISGQQGRLLRALAPAARIVSSVLERTPGLRRLGVSQLIVAEARPVG